MRAPCVAHGELRETDAGESARLSPVLGPASITVVTSCSDFNCADLRTIFESQTAR